ncbi:MAG TPA: serine hydrolase domain-containing protein [Thermoanaerobaculia bacterium]
MSAPESLRALLDEGLERGFFAGVTALVASEKETLAERHAGDARLEPASERRAAGPDTLWDLASLTKPLAGAALVLSLVSEKTLSLDDCVSRFEDRWKKTFLEGVSVRSLLAHLGGLVDWFPLYSKGEGRPAYVRTLGELDAAAIPGTKVIYSCPGYLFLSEIVERVAGGTLDRLFEARVSAPLHLSKNLLFSPSSPEDLARCAGGERNDATERRMTADRKLKYGGFREGVVNGQVNDGNAYRRGNGVSLNAGLFGTAEAAAALGRAWLARDGRLLPERFFALATENATAGLGEDRGLGWQLASTPGSAGEPLGPSAYGHTGFTGASLFVAPELGRVAVLLANRLHPEARAAEMNDFRRRFHEIAAAL